MKFQLSSTAFRENEAIPQAHTCDGRDLSPLLEWDGAPDKTASFAIVCEDPDAPVGTWIHWVIFNLPGNSRGLPEGVPADKQLSNGARQGMNDFRRMGYGGPCPPPGPAHRYYFRIYALDNTLDLQAGASRKDLDRAMRGHILAEAALMGRYQRKR